MWIKSVWFENLTLIVLAFILMMLLGCSYPVVKKSNPVLTRDCDNPELQGPTYRDAIILSIEQAKALEECTGRMRVLAK